ncbi:hypothetical protein GSI_10220 [Ganoderma sinense ZZ0214-1]|uniref:Uncharacterized protein n=1 Tax=Ganoderma sinense ZZ0214-1 TaxID=1077348 RepID=A0A2G8RZY8_9APHY|nr:hypothetical protein GSI_10220 [Ganoderma sinense ZZ0214-1]
MDLSPPETSPALPSNGSPFWTGKASASRSSTHGYTPHLTWQGSLRGRTFWPSEDRAHAHTDMLANVNVCGDADTLLFVDKSFFDVAAHAVELAPDVMHMLPLLVRQSVLFVSVDAGRGVHDMHSGMRVWKALLPALFERSRATRAHGPNCEYRVVA